MSHYRLRTLKLLFRLNQKEWVGKPGEQKSQDRPTVFCVTLDTRRKQNVNKRPKYKKQDWDESQHLFINLIGGFDYRINLNPLIIFQLFEKAIMATSMTGDAA